MELDLRRVAPRCPREPERRRSERIEGFDVTGDELFVDEELDRKAPRPRDPHRAEMLEDDVAALRVFDAVAEVAAAIGEGGVIGGGFELVDAVQRAEVELVVRLVVEQVCEAADRIDFVELPAEIGIDDQQPVFVTEVERPVVAGSDEFSPGKVTAWQLGLGEHLDIRPVEDAKPVVALEEQATVSLDDRLDRNEGLFGGDFALHEALDVLADELVDFALAENDEGSGEGDDGHNRRIEADHVERIPRFDIRRVGEAKLRAADDMTDEEALEIAVEDQSVWRRLVAPCIDGVAKLAAREVVVEGSAIELRDQQIVPGTSARPVEANLVSAEIGCQRRGDIDRRPFVLDGDAADRAGSGFDRLADDGVDIQHDLARREEAGC